MRIFHWKGIAGDHSYCCIPIPSLSSIVMGRSFLSLTFSQALMFMKISRQDWPKDWTCKMLRLRAPDLQKRSISLGVRQRSDEVQVVQILLVLVSDSWRFGVVYYLLDYAFENSCISYPNFFPCFPARCWINCHATRPERLPLVIHHSRADGSKLSFISSL